MSDVIDIGTTADHTWNSDCILLPAQFTNPLTGQVYQTEINLVEYMGKNSTYAHENNKNDPFFAEHTKVHLFPDRTDDERETILAIAEEVIRACAKDGFELAYSGYSKQYNYLSFRCKRNTLYKSMKNPESRQKRLKPTHTKFALIEEHRCHFRFGFVYRDRKWKFSAGSGIPCHVHHVRKVENLTVRANHRLANEYGRPDRPNRADRDAESSDEECQDPLQAADRVVRKACQLTRTQWQNGKELWQDPTQSTAQTYELLWNEICETCDDSYHATAIMQ
ncbi:hypothetical protein FisN_32Lu052 [Fistulifera solaris]|uniref:Uncharacterized protein n=1 Tax=Fistulifera solaris TaxID=1519565 RepID=A0A1Z5KNU1_FISSO|nr:hypothetical protein FisN_32Lu052 [Fistulifera solaris]|eukprot:GAX27949.1 hypothetical protein FisN_32Lu052 [Fistulifera solaris]